MGVRAHGNAKGSCEPKVCKFEGIGLAIYEEILGFEVAVEDTPGVAEEEAHDHLVEETLLIIQVRIVIVDSL